FGLLSMTRLGALVPNPREGLWDVALDSSGEFAMKGLRIHRLLASTAAILLVASMASIASAEPKFGTMDENAAAPAASAPSGDANSSAKPTEPPNQAPNTTPTAKPQAEATPVAPAVVANVRPEDMRGSSTAAQS